MNKAYDFHLMHVVSTDALIPDTVVCFFCFVFFSSGALAWHLCLPVLPQVSRKVAVTRSITRFIFSSSRLISALPRRQSGRASRATVSAKKVLFFNWPSARYELSSTSARVSVLFWLFPKDNQHSSVLHPFVCQ